jgi:hypothetical protein
MLPPLIVKDEAYQSNGCFSIPLPAVGSAFAGAPVLVVRKESFSLIGSSASGIALFALSYKVTFKHGIDDRSSSQKLFPHRFGCSG